jgi:biopolymer transport protein ExbB
MGANSARRGNAAAAGRGRRIIARLALLFAVLFGLGAPVMAAENAGWWSNDWSYRKAVTIDTSPSGVNVTGAVGRTVVLLRLHSGNFTFADALPNGADIRLIDSDNKTPLAFHIDRYDAQNALATVWVSVPNLTGGEKRQIWMYFGNKTAPAGSDAKATFDPDTMAAFHFGENPGQPSVDSTANANLTKTAPPGVNDSGIIGRSARFPGQGAINVDPSGSLAMPAGAPFTLSLWVKPAQLAGQQAVFSRGAFAVGLNAGVPYVAGVGAPLAAKTSVKQGDWTHLAFVSDGKTFHLYVGGIEEAAAPGAMPALDGPLTIGGAAGQSFNGEIDELRLAKTARPANMILAMAQAEGAGGKLVSVAETAEKQSSGGGVLFFIISKLEPIDMGIIGICLTLLAAAIALITAKVLYLNAADKGNQRFIRRFAEMRDELVPIAEAEGVSPQEASFIGRTSPVARLYAVGLAELEARQRTWGNRPLSGEAVNSMRAAVDAQFVTENQKLDKLMVILTIAISGGPFIGLLGTVIGVMTVFGGVALAGDVNVNAIAPGIAAALLATIAGLTCAIPALFGYNYLNGRLTALTDQMRVFIERLVTQLAEMQADAATRAKTAE